MIKDNPWMLDDWAIQKTKKLYPKINKKTRKRKRKIITKKKKTHRKKK